MNSDMESNNQMEYMFSLIQQLSDKVEFLEKKIELLSTNKKSSVNSIVFRPRPEICFDKWVESLRVTNDILQYTFEKGILNGAKEAIISNFQSVGEPPIISLMRPKRLYIFSEEDWQPFTEYHLSLLVNELWRKFLSAFLDQRAEENLEEKMDQDIENPTNNNEQYRRDLFMKNILEMKTKLLQNHRREIIRLLFEETKTQK